MLGSHDADLSTLVERVTDIAGREVGRQYLERSIRDGTWEIADVEAAGRFIYCEDEPEGPYQVVVDGHTLSWDELGRSLAAFEGWEFRLAITDHPIDVRDDAKILPFAVPATPNEADPSDPARTWTVTDLRAAVAAYEEHLRLSGMSTGSIRTHLDRTGAFIAWLAGEPPIPRTSSTAPDDDVTRALGWAQARNDRLPDRAVGQIRYEVDIEGPSITMYECRPPWRPEDGPDWTRIPIVRFRYTKARQQWATYSRDRNLKFHRHDPMPPSRNLQDLIDAVETDHNGTFWG